MNSPREWWCCSCGIRIHIKAVQAKEVVDHIDYSLPHSGSFLLSYLGCIALIELIEISNHLGIHYI